MYLASITRVLCVIGILGLTTICGCASGTTNEPEPLGARSVVCAPDEVSSAPLAADEMWVLGTSDITSGGHNSGTQLMGVGTGEALGFVLLAGGGVEVGESEYELANFCNACADQITFSIEGMNIRLQAEGINPETTERCTLELSGTVDPCGHNSEEMLYGMLESVAYDVQGEVAVLMGEQRSTITGVQLVRLAEPTVCADVPTTLDELDWMLFSESVDPLFFSFLASAAKRTMVMVGGYGEEAGFGSISEVDTCSSLFSEVDSLGEPACYGGDVTGSVAFDGVHFSVDIEVADAENGDVCSIQFSGQVTECVIPVGSLLSLLTLTADRGSRLRLDGDGTYAAAGIEGTLTRMFLYSN